jgi:serine/threonine protein kinase
MSLLQPGRVFANDYRVVRHLSSGGMGSVFVVEQLSTGKERALKVMHSEFSSSSARPWTSTCGTPGTGWTTRSRTRIA